MSKTVTKKAERTVQEVAKTLQTHVSEVAPGNPFHLSSRNSINDGVAQGDLNVVVAENKVPKGFVKVEPSEANRQLAIEAGVGSHHRIKSWDGVEMWRSPDWGKNDSNLTGPFIRFTKPNAIVHEPGHAHPHGTVFIDDALCIQISYQRNLTQEEREIRARD